MRSRKAVFIEALALMDGHFSGIGQYTLGILQGIDKYLDQATADKLNTPEIYVVIPHDTIHRFRNFGFKHLKYKAIRIPFGLMSKLWQQNKMPPLDLLCGNGTYVFTRFADMRLANPRNTSCVVIYDISFELYRQYADEGHARFLSTAVRRSLARASKIITISENAKREIVDFYKVDPNSVCVAYPATDPGLLYRRPKADIEKVKQNYGISGDYILALSNLEPRKNLELLVRAYCRLPDKYRKNLSLLLVGVSGWKTDKLFDEIIDRVTEGYDIIRPSKYVSDEDKPAIISGAKMLVYPSHYEGFGMPPLEALACGTPVITADNSSLPEAVGNNAAMINSNNLDELVGVMEDYLDNYATISKKAQVQGTRFANEFSWEKSAEIILKHIGAIK